MPTRQAHLIATCLGLVALGCGGAGRIDEACRSNADCAATELCATGFCGGIGVCNPRPEMCDDSEFAEVCGCDGLTYQNRCFAEIAGVRLAATGPCVCDDNAECLIGQFCALDNGCTNRGACLPTPQTCDPSDTQEVCGCDGMTYDNECTAFQSGVRVSALGTCDCQTNADCAASDYCGALVCNGPGVCAPRSVPACDPDALVEGCCDPDAPVTGCDGVVYPSECDAISMGVRVRPED